jgi:imidazolonepropionase-like amidohydrolase
LKLWVFALALLTALPGCAGLHERPRDSSPASQLAIVGVTVIPMTDAAALPDRTVIVRDGRIAAIGPRRRLRVPAGAQQIDGRGRYLMPGLADMHVHLEYIEDPDVLKLFVASGVTTVRSMDGRPYVLEWRERVRRGELIGPRIVTAGPIIDGSPPARDDNLAVADAAAAQGAVASQAAAGYDFIKLYSNLSREAYAAAVAEARRRGLRVAGHVPRAVPLDTALGAQWSIEHLGDFASAVAADGGPPTPGWARRALAAPLDGQRLDALARRLAAAQVWVVPTAVQQDRWLAPPATVRGWLAEPSIRSLPPSVLAQWRAPLERLSERMDDEDWAMLERARRNRLAVITALHRAGVRLAIGSDTPNPFVAMGASVHLELANFVAAGLSPADALKAATVNAARMLGLESGQGTVEVGKRADLLLLVRNPLEDAVNASAISGVVLGGRWFDDQALRAMAQDLGRR